MNQSYLDERSTPERLVLVGIGLEIGLAVLALFAGWLIGVDVLATWRWQLAGLAWGIAATLPLLLVMRLVMELNWAPFRRLRHVVEKVLIPAFRHCSWEHLVLISLAAGVGEELLFRGLIQQVASDWTWPLVGLLVASVLFGAAHPITPTYGILAALIGIYLGGLWLLTDNLLAPIVTHALYDYLALEYLVRRHRRREGLPDPF